MAKIVFDDGKQVELSSETTKRLRDELVKPEHPIATVCKCKDNGDRRFILNIPDEYLVKHLKGLLLVLNSKGEKRNSSCYKHAPLPNYYINHKKVF